MDVSFMATSYLPGGAFQQHQEVIRTYGRTYFGRGMERGTIGIVLSHLSVLQDAYNSGYETVWVMEDDIEVVRNPRLISGLIEQLDMKIGKGNWDILFTDQDTRDKNGNYV